MDRATLVGLDHAALVELVLQLVAEQATMVAGLQAQIDDLQRQVAELQRENAELKARPTLTSRNSSRPPSSDLPGSRPAPPKGQPGSRRPGGQPGHPGHHRELLPPEQVDRIVTLVPAFCRGCGTGLSALAGPGDPAVERQQVAELPPVRVEITEFQLEARRCGACGQTTRAERPAGVGEGSFGPRLQGAVAILSGRYRLSRREVVGALADLWGVPIGLGSVVELERATSAALAPVVAVVADLVQRAKRVNMDETGWWQGRKRAWLWVVVTATLTLFRIAPSRAGAVARELLGPTFRGLVGSDRYAGYAWLEIPWRQLCWAHLKRDFQKLVDRGGTAAATGTAALAIEREMFALWHRFKQGELDRAALQREIKPLQIRLWQVLDAGVQGEDGQTAGFCAQLGKYWPALWTFIHYEGIEPTNNVAERALRPAVLWRKGSFGCHSAEGSRFAERMLTVAATCRQQGRNLLEFVVAANEAARLGTPPPSLVHERAA